MSTDVPVVEFEGSEFLPGVLDSARGVTSPSNRPPVDSIVFRAQYEPSAKGAVAPQPGLLARTKAFAAALFDVISCA